MAIKNLVAKLLVSVLSTLAEIDYNNRRETQAEGIARAQAEGKKPREGGTTLPDSDLVEKHANIIRQLPGHSIRQMARLTGKSNQRYER